MDCLILGGGEAVGDISDIAESAGDLFGDIDFD